MTTQGLQSGSSKERLTTKHYWEQGHGGGSEELAEVPFEPDPRWWKRPPGAYTGMIMKHFLSRHLPRGEHLRFLEVGAAPGRNAVQFHRDFGYQPHGVEYTDSGVRLLRATFEANGFPAANAFHADFFSPQFLAAHKGAFDVVGSFGFLEHFGDPKQVVRNHAELLRPGGHLVISVPNFRYVNYYLKAFFNRDFIPTHNLELMDLDNFRACFDMPELEVISSGPIGSYRFPEPSHTEPWKRVVEKVMGKMQLVLNALLMSTVGERAPESRYFSSQLICIARKVDP